MTFRAAAACALLACGAGTASAGTIQLLVASRVTTGVDPMRVEIDVRNQGDEAASNVVPIVRFRERTLTGEVVDTIDPSAERTIGLAIPVPDTAQWRGQWPIVVRVRYTDAGGAVHEAIHVTLARFGGAAEASGVRLHAADARFDEQVRVNVRVAVDDPGGDVRLRFVAGAGLVVSPGDVTVAPGSRGATVPVTVTNVSAARGSRLPFAAIAEVNTAGGHQAAVATSMLEIGTPPAPWRDRIAIVLFLVFAGAWGAILLRARRRPPHA